MVKCDQAVLEDSARLSSTYSDNNVSLEHVLRVLNRSKVTFVLAGPVGLSGWTKRPSVERVIEFFIPGKNLGKAATMLEGAFPGLRAVDGLLRKRLVARDTKTTVINLIEPVMEPEKEVFKNTRPTKIGDQPCRIPSLEMAMAMTLRAMTSIYRSGVEQMLDAYEFSTMACHHRQLDLNKLEKLVAPMFPGAEKVARDKVSFARAVAHPVV